MGTICLIVWVMLIYHGLALAGCIFLGKFMFQTNLIWLSAILEPSRTSKSIASTASLAIRHALWTVGYVAVLFVLYSIL